MTIGLGSDDPRAVASAQGFDNRDPVAILNNPGDPNGASDDLGINLAFNIDDLVAGESATGTLVLTLGRSVDEAVANYDAAAAITPARPLDEHRRASTAGRGCDANQRRIDQRSCHDDFLPLSDERL